MRDGLCESMRVWCKKLVIPKTLPQYISNLLSHKDSLLPLGQRRNNDKPNSSTDDEATQQRNI